MYLRRSLALRNKNTTNRSFFIRHTSSATGHSPSRQRPLVSAEWLADNLKDVKIVDSSWYMPALKRSCYNEFLQCRIPGSVFFDIDKIADLSVPLPHMLPSPEVFAHAVGQFGISEKDQIIVYDTAGIISSPRTWWTFLTFGAPNVYVLEGGMPAWLRKNLPVHSGPVQTIQPAVFTPNMDRTRVRNFEHMYKNATSFSSAPQSSKVHAPSSVTSAATPNFAVVDARSSGRFSGVDAEPRPNLRSGNIPNSVSLPFGEVLTEDSTNAMTLKSKEELVKVFTKAGLDLKSPDSPITTTCGSGLTAAILALALHTTGHKNISLYDGSWTEYGAKTRADNSKV